MIRRPPRSTPLSLHDALPIFQAREEQAVDRQGAPPGQQEEGRESQVQHVLQHRLEPHQEDARDRKSTRLNSSHANISYAVFCLKKKKKSSQETNRSIYTRR